MLQGPNRSGEKGLKILLLYAITIKYFQTANGFTGDIHSALG